MSNAEAQRRPLGAFDQRAAYKLACWHQISMPPSYKNRKARLGLARETIL